MKFCPLPCAKCHVHRNNVYRLYGAENPFWTTEYIKCNTGRHTAPRAFMPVISNFGDFSACKPTFLKPQPWTLAWGYGPVTPSPASSIVKVAQGDLPPRGNFFYQILEIFAILSFHAHISVVIIFQFGLREWYKISSKSLKGPVGIALPRRWCILIYSFICF